MHPDQILDAGGIPPDWAADVVAVAAERLGWYQRTLFTPAEVVELLTEAEFDVQPNTLAEVVRKGIIVDPGKLWDSTAVVALAMFLHTRRRWRLTPSRWDQFKSKPRLMIERYRALGSATPIVDLDQFTTREILNGLVEPLQ